jgi:branched-chain amino acid transport system ATP-binding protein
VQVLRDITLAVPDGTVVALLGPNGAGKTTLLRAASGLISPSTGRILLDDVDVTGQAPERLVSCGICHVGEGRAIFRGMSVRENLRMFAVPGEEDALTERAVAAFPVLGRRLSQVAGTMSGGEQQMLALSRAHRSDAKVVLLDEVSMGLAPKIVDEIFEFLGELCRGGASLLLVEQYAERALALADFVFVLNRGRCVFAGEPGEISHDDLFDRYMAASA